jgi:L-fucose mutarotase
MLEAIKDIFPVDVDYSQAPATVMELTESDQARGMTTPVAWEEYLHILMEKYPEIGLCKLERYDFYEKAKAAYVVIQTGEERHYGNLILTKGVVL